LLITSPFSRGIRGLCARIQHITPEIEIEFGSAEYSEKRLGEYWAWRGEAGGKEELLLRERRWAQEA